MPGTTTHSEYAIYYYSYLIGFATNLYYLGYELGTAALPIQTLVTAMWLNGDERELDATIFHGSGRQQPSIITAAHYYLRYIYSLIHHRQQVGWLWLSYETEQIMEKCSDNKVIVIGVVRNGKLI